MYRKKLMRACLMGTLVVSMAASNVAPYAPLAATKVEAKETQSVGVNYWDIENDVQAGEGKVTVDADATQVNTSALTDVPNGYEIASTGDITINDGWIWVEVKPVATTQEIGVNYWDVENNKQAGEGKVTVDAGANNVNTSALTDVPEGYEISRTGDVQINDGWIFVEVRPAAEKTVEIGVNYWDVDKNEQAGEGKVTVDAGANNVNTSALTDIPDGYELVNTGDITINDGWIWVAVRPVQKDTILRIDFVLAGTDDVVDTDVATKTGKLGEQIKFKFNEDFYLDNDEYQVVNTTGNTEITVMAGTDTTMQVVVEKKDVPVVTKTVGVNYWDVKNDVQAGEGEVTVAADANNVNTSTLTDIPEGYELVSTGDVEINDGWIWVEVKPVATTQEVGVNYWDIVNNTQAGEGKVTVAADANNVNTSALTDIPEGYELTVSGDITINDGWIWVEVKPVATTQEIGVNYWDVENDVQAGEGKVTVAADAYNVNTSVLTDIPEGYELASTGDIKINDGWIYVEVRPAAEKTVEIGVNYWDVENNKQAGEGKVTVDADAYNVNTSALTDIPEGYELVNVGDVTINDGWIYVEVKPVKAESTIIHVTFKSEGGKDLGGGDYFVDADGDGVFNYSELTLPEGYELIETGDTFVDTDKTYEITLHKTNPGTIINVVYVDENGNNLGGGDYFVDMDDDGIANFSELDVPEGYKLVVTGDFFVADYTGQTNEIKVEKIQKGTIINVVFEDRQGNNLGGGDYLVDEDGDGVANYSELDLPAGYKLIETGDFFVKDAADGMTVVLDRDGSAIIHVVFKSEGGKNLGGGDYFVDEDGDGVFNYSELDLPVGYELIVTGDEFVDTDKTYEITLHKINAGTIINVVFVDEEGNNLGGGDYFVDMDDDGIANFSELTLPEGYELIVTGDFFVDEYVGHSNTIVLKKIEVIRDASLRVTFETTDGKKVWATKMMTKEGVEGEDVVFSLGEDFHLPLFFKLAEGVDQITDITIPAGSVGGHTMIVEPIFDVRLPKLQLHLKQ